MTVFQRWRAKYRREDQESKEAHARWAKSVRDSESKREEARIRWVIAGNSLLDWDEQRYHEDQLRELLELNPT